MNWMDWASGFSLGACAALIITQVMLLRIRTAARKRLADITVKLALMNALLLAQANVMDAVADNHQGELEDGFRKMAVNLRATAATLEVAS